MANYNIVTGGELQHRDHKYIKKYQVNGKWRYVYADQATHREIKDTADEIPSLKTATEIFRDNARGVNDYTKEMSPYLSDGERKRLRLVRNENRKQAAIASWGVRESKRQYEALVSAHEAKTLTAARAKADKVASKVKSFISKITKR